MIRSLLYQLAKPLIWILKPVKIYAYRTRFELLRRLILEVTTFIDWALVFALMQNESMWLHQDIYRGNFIFGKGVMVVDHAAAAQHIAQPMLKNNNFLGVRVVSGDNDVFATNSPILQQDQPVRRLTRTHINSEVFSERVRGYDEAALAELLAPMLTAWKDGPDMANFVKIRSVATQLFVKILSEKSLPIEAAESITFNYFRRFGELSALGYYFPTLAGVLGSRERIRRDAYEPLKAFGVDIMVVEMVLFAAMFSVGTLVMRVIDNVRRYGVAYAGLSDVEKRHYIIESLRLYPTVCSIHRVLDRDEEVVVARKTLRLQAGNEIVYPIVCSHRDPKAFVAPETFNIHRPEEEYDRVLSWSKGFHECPAKELSILVTKIMLDTLASKYDFAKLKIFQVLI